MSSAQTRVYQILSFGTLIHGTWRAQTHCASFLTCVSCKKGDPILKAATKQHTSGLFVTANILICFWDENIQKILQSLSRYISSKACMIISLHSWQALPFFSPTICLMRIFPIAALPTSRCRTWRWRRAPTSRTRVTRARCRRSSAPCPCRCPAATRRTARPIMPRKS